LASTTPSRYPSRGTKDRETLHQIIDEGLFCTIAFNRDGIPHQIPTGFCRVDNHIYIHASSKSGFMDAIINSQISFSITLMDALVLAPSAFDHSFNYRSVIGFATAEEIVDPNEKLKFFNLFTNRYIPNRIADVGEPTADEVKITKIVSLSLDNAAAKIRIGDVNVKLKPEDAWCGIIPVNQTYGTPIMDTQLPSEKNLPQYILDLVNGNKSY
jgi:uncharacterized protein